MKIEKILEKAHEKDICKMVEYLDDNGIDFSILTKDKFTLDLGLSSLIITHFDEPKKLDLLFLDGILTSVKFDDKEPMLIDREDVLI